jgi:hypothetical protein
MHGTRKFLLSFLLVTAPLLIPDSVFAAWSRGKLTVIAQTGERCPQGYNCNRFQVAECPKVAESAIGELAIGPGYGSPRGLVMFFTGKNGRAWWTDTRDRYNFAEQLRGLGFTIVQVRWSDSWLVSAPGEIAGIAHLACRPATVIKYVHKQYYVPLGLNPARGEAGFAITGNSGGASQVAYSLSHYGLDRILDVVIPTGGPPHSALAKSCSKKVADKKYWLTLSQRKFVDEGFGFFSGDGPCAAGDASYIPRWKKESTSKGGSDHYHPKTRIHFILGKKDHQMRNIARDYYLRLKHAKSPHVTWEVVSDTQHTVSDTQQGLTALMNAILTNEDEPSSP